MNDLSIEHLPLNTLKPNPANARRHSQKQLHQIAASISEFGFNSIVVVDEESTILVGHGRVEGARIAGLATVPVMRVGHLTAQQKIAFSLADNKIALNSDWEMDQLRVLWRELMGAEINFDVEVTGFGTAEIDLLIDGEASRDKPDRSDLIPAIQAQAVSRPGDLWILGEHRLLCGDARDPSSFAEVMGDDQARLVFTDPPYNVPIDGHVSGLGTVKHREFQMASGEMSTAEFAGFLRTIFGNMADVSFDGAIHYICMDWRHMGEMLQAAHGLYSELKNLCVWNKNNGGMGSFYRSKHELVFAYKVGTAPHLNTIELGKHGRYRTNVWDYAGVNSFHSGRDAELEMHPTVKPTALVIDAIKDCSRRGDIVLDPFSGSGTTIMAAHKCRRRARAIELDPLYVDVAIRRWQSYSGAPATMAITGETFADIEQRRADPLQ